MSCDHVQQEIASMHARLAMRTHVIHAISKQTLAHADIHGPA